MCLKWCSVARFHYLVSTSRNDALQSDRVCVEVFSLQPPRFAVQADRFSKQIRQAFPIRLFLFVLAGIAGTTSTETAVIDLDKLSLTGLSWILGREHF